MKNWKYMLAIIIGLAVFGTLPMYAGVYLMQVVDIIFIYMILAISWDMILRTGQLSFGIAGFVGIGGYATVIASLNFNVDPFLSIVIGGAAGGLIALLVGIAVLHLRGLYFAIITLAIGEIVRVVVRNMPDITGGPEGMILPNAIFDGASTPTYYLALIMAVLVILLSEIFQNSRVRFALTTIRNDEIVAKSSGINVFKYLVIMFAVTSAIQGMAGGLYAQMYASVTPDGTFSLEFVLLPMALTLLGGVFNTWGSVLGAFILVSIAEYLKLQIPHGHLIVYGVIIIVAILYMPMGVAGIIRQKLFSRFAKKQITN